MSAFRERAYQLEVNTALIGAQARNVRRALVVLPTGLGKTVSLTRAPSVLGIKRPDVTLILAHRKELIEQTVRKVRGWDPNTWVEIEMADSRASGMCEVVVGSVASLDGDRLDDFLLRFARRIKLLIVDEAHHATASSYTKLIQRVLDERPDSQVLGFTATPNRSDSIGLSAVFDEVVYHRDIKWAIDEGYLVDVECWRVRTGVSLDQVHVRAGEFAQNELASIVNNEGRNDVIVSAYAEHAAGMKAIVFCVDVAHAHAMSDRFNDAGIPAAYAHGGTPKHEREQILARFRRGEVQVLCNCALWTEGFDEPSIEVVIPARPTKSALLYTQMAGRGLRPLDEIAHHLGPETSREERRAAIASSRKPRAIILDVVDQARRHTLLSFPTLWGLPPNLDGKGKRVTEIAKKYDELAEKDPEIVNALLEQREPVPFEMLQTLIEKVNQFAVPKIDPFVAENTELAWLLVSNDTYRLRLPSRIIARNQYGEDVPNFDAQYRAKSREIGSFKRGEVLAAMNISAEDVIDRREVLEIHRDVLGKAEVWISDGDDARMLGKVEELPEAFKRAETWLTKNRPGVNRALSTTASWTSQAPTEKQLGMLKSFKVPPTMMPRTMGEASRLITKLLESKKSKAS